CLLLPVKRQELLQATAMLLSVDKRRTFKTLLTIEDPSGHTYMGTSEDFSSAGISFTSEGQINEKLQVSLQFYLPGQERIRLLATIMRKIDMPDSNHFYGARFVDPQNRFSGLIRNFID